MSVRLSFLLSLLFTVVTCTSIMASHLLGGDITWRCDGNGKYIFKVRLYRDCNGIPGPGSLSLSTDAPGTGGNINCVLTALNDLTPTGSGCPTCTNPLGYISAIQEFIFESAPVQINCLQTGDLWSFWYNDCCRSALDNCLAGTFTLRSKMRPLQGNVCQDNSPQFMEPPVMAVCGGPNRLNSVAFDPELDSLIFELTTPYTSASYYPPYSAMNPLPDSTVNPLNKAVVIDRFTGDAIFTSYTGGRYMLAARMNSYHCGRMNAEIYREMELMISSDCYISPTRLNKSPEINYYSASTNQIITADTINAGDHVNYIIYATDSDTSDTGIPQQLSVFPEGPSFGTGLSDTLTGCNIAPCAIVPGYVNTGTGAVWNMIDWNTGCSHASTFNGCLQHQRTWMFTTRAEDNFCPVRGVSFNTLPVVVSGPELNTDSSGYLYVHANGASLQWYLDGVAIPGATDSIIQTVSSGVYSLIATAPGGCQLISNARYAGVSAIDENAAGSSQLLANYDDAGMLNLIVKHAVNGKYNLTVTTADGKSIYKSDIAVNDDASHFVIDQQVTSAGIYLISLSQGNTLLTAKAIRK